MFVVLLVFCLVRKYFAKLSGVVVGIIALPVSSGVGEGDGTGGTECAGDVDEIWETTAKEPLLCFLDGPGGVDMSDEPLITGNCRMKK
jgi:hypothetical protein